MGKEEPVRFKERRFNITSTNAAKITKRCSLCALPEQTRGKIVRDYIRGAKVAQLAQAHGAGTTTMFNHLRRCEADNIARKKLVLHRAIDWAALLNDLKMATDLMAERARNAEDAQSTLSFINDLTDVIGQRVKIAADLQNRSQQQLALAFAKVVMEFIRNCPVDAPAIIAAILDEHPACHEAIERYTKDDP